VADESRPGEPARAGFGATIVAVLWSFFGVRRKSDHDAARLNPVAVIVAGVVAAAIFVVVLLLIVRSVVK
jgi:hypothetical protein